MIHAGSASTMLVTYGFQPASVRTFASSSRFTVRVPPLRVTNRFRLIAACPGNGLLGLGDLLVDAVHGPAGPVGLVLIEGGAAPLVGLGTHDCGLGERRPVGRLGVRVGLPPLLDYPRQVGQLPADHEAPA